MRLEVSAVTLFTGILMGYPIAASAHGKNSHDSYTEAQMHKLHDMMPMFSLASAEIETAIGKGDATTVKAQAERILAALPDLKKSKPHKNLKEIASFKAIASKFGDDVSNVHKLAEKGDFRTAKEVYAKLKNRCNECHSKFRD
jgi:cytochrome c556